MQLNNNWHRARQRRDAVACHWDGGELSSFAPAEVPAQWTLKSRDCVGFIITLTTIALSGDGDTVTDCTSIHV
jgi:hypothetical protein